jgi:CTP synthase (UTP-ammonia lyase)
MGSQKLTALLDIYDRFLDITLTARHNITTGKIYTEVGIAIQANV